MGVTAKQQIAFTATMQMAHLRVQSIFHLLTQAQKIQTRLEFDLEGSSYDNFCIELSTNNGTTWTGHFFHKHFVDFLLQVSWFNFSEVVTPCPMELLHMTNQEDL